jgi:hypothetical protein
MSVVKYRLDDNVAVLEIDNPPVNATSISVRERFQGWSDLEKSA